MNSPWKLIIFDLDGTLIDTIGDLGAAVDFSMAEAGFPTHSIEEYKLMVGNGVRNLVKRALPEEYRDSQEILDSRLASFIKYYSANIDRRSKPYEGMKALLDKLSGKAALAVASNKFQAGTERLISTFYGDIPFCLVAGNGEGHPLKPSREVVDLCIKAAGLSPDDASGVVIVGDSAPDIQTSKNAGISSIGVTWGFRCEEELKTNGADRIARTVNELEEYLIRP